MNALAHDLNYPILRKNKNIDAFLNRCKSFSVSGDCANVDKVKTLALSLKNADKIVTMQTSMLLVC